MVRTQNAGLRRCRRPLVAGATLGLFLAACQGPDEFYRGHNVDVGQGGSGPTGAAGSMVTGAAGSMASGTAGSMVSGTAGSMVSGTAGTSAAAGTNGAAGTTAAAGTSGAAGRGGTTGTAGMTGRGGTTGAAGTTGRGGTTGTAGTMGRGGTTGRGGATGTAGTSGANSCPLGGTLNCTTGSLDMTPDGMVVDFSPAQWNSTTQKFCDTHGLDGGISAYAPTGGSMATAAVDTTAQNLRLSLTVTAGQFALGRLNFDSCVDASTFNSVGFTVSVASGSLTNCSLQVQIQTQDKRPSSATNPSGGTCTTNCEQYPTSVLNPQPMGTTATPYTIPFSSFNNASSVMTRSQITGLQWQVNSGNNGQGTCTVELRIDNIRFGQ